MEAISLEQHIETLRTAQRDWSATAVGTRAAIAKRFSGLIANRSRTLHEAIQTPQRTDYRETITAEILPLADAASWLAKNASKILRARKVGAVQRPIWIGRVRSIVVREPVGVVLIIGTWNYPLFLTGVQMLQTIVAGNAVVVKPAPGSEAITARIRDLLVESGVPPSLIVVLDASIESVERAIATRVDKIVMTGSSRGGRAVLARLAQQITPATMELSGSDAVFVLDGADMERVIAALLFGLRLNGGATCLAPRRVYVPRSQMAPLVARLSERIDEILPTTIPSATAWRILSEIDAGRAQIVLPARKQAVDLDDSASISRWITAGLPVVLTNVAIDCMLANADIFAPLAMLFPYESIDNAVQLDSRCPYGLTACIFGDEAEAKALAARLNVGSVIINDLIVPTADPRLPFGGVRESGFGVTRGVEGLLELTRPKVISIRRGRWLPHLDTPKPRDGQVLEGLLQWLHEPTWSMRVRGLMKIVRAFTDTKKRRE